MVAKIPNWINFTDVWCCKAFSYKFHNILFCTIMLCIYETNKIGIGLQDSSLIFILFKTIKFSYTGIKCINSAMSDQG